MGDEHDMGRLETISGTHTYHGEVEHFPSDLFPFRYWAYVIDETGATLEVSRHATKYGAERRVRRSLERKRREYIRAQVKGSRWTVEE